MSVRVSSQLHRFALPQILFVVVVVATPLGGYAGDPEIGSGPEDATTTCEFELRGTEELCGWGDVCPLGTHDSGALPTPAAARAIPPVPVAYQATRFDTSVEESVTAIATAALASAGISVEQIVEPFAMVGPYLDDSLEKVREFQAWWKQAQAKSESHPTASEAIEVELEQIAAQEPIDVESFGPSVIVETLPALQVEPSVQVTPINPLIGSSPIIATIEEGYHPYDLAARDLKLWSVFPSSRHPFCVRSHMDAFDETPMWEDFDQAVQVDATDTPEVEEVSSYGSAACLLADLIRKYERLVAEDSSVSIALQPRGIGRSVAKLATTGDRIFRGAAQLLALSWPDTEAREADDEPSAAGGALLARAGAINASEPVAANATAEWQVAEVPSGSALR